jgi:hypothetical protein
MWNFVSSLPPLTLSTNKKSGIYRLRSRLLGMEVTISQGIHTQLSTYTFTLQEKRSYARK